MKRPLAAMTWYAPLVICLRMGSLSSRRARTACAARCLWRGWPARPSSGPGGRGAAPSAAGR
eukprot:15222147-Alexandrium_andersonii.AAC.1